MKQRIDFQQYGNGIGKALYGLGAYLSKCSLDKNLLELVYFRVSQINGCAFCLDMHAKDLRAAGETEQRLYLTSAWRETDVYSERERAAFAWAEAVTKLTNNDVPDDVYETAAAQFSEQELMDLTIAVTTINTYNRLNVAYRVQGGSYKVGQFATAN